MSSVHPNASSLLALLVLLTCLGYHMAQLRRLQSPGCRSSVVAIGVVVRALRLALRLYLSMDSGEFRPDGDPVNKCPIFHLRILRRARP